MKEKKERKRGGWLRVLLIILLVIIALILIAVAIVGAYMNHLMNQVNIVPKEDSTISSSEVDQMLETDPDLAPIDPDSEESLPNISEITTFPTEPEEESEGSGGTQNNTKYEHIVNIMLIGQDRRPGEGRARSDSMILLTFNKATGEITLTSFMRDSYVQIPGYKPHKLNHSYQYGGMSLLNETLRVNFGVEVDGNVEVDFSGFTEIIDLLGGVDISLTQAEADYMVACGDPVTKGLNRLNGEQALAYSRIRYLDSDYRRAERQRKVLLSLIDRYKSLSLPETLSILEEVLGLVTTNMDKAEIIGYATELFPMLATADFDTLRIPADGTFKGGNVKVREGLTNWFQYNIDFEANRKLLRDVFDDD